MDQDLCARRCQRCLVEIKGTVELCFGGEFWIDVQGTEEIQSGGGLFNELTPQMESGLVVLKMEIKWSFQVEMARSAAFPRWTHEAGQAIELGHAALFMKHSFS